MEPLRQSLAADFLKRIEKELGRETTLRLLWPYVVGSRLAANTQLKSIRGATLIVSVPDRSWLRPLASLDKMILEAANRLGGARLYEAIEFLEEPQKFPSREAARAGAGTKASPACPEPAAVEFDAGMIADENLRRIFLGSAKKYFSTPPGAAPEGDSAFPAPEGRRK